MGARPKPAPRRSAGVEQGVGMESLKLTMKNWRELSLYERFEQVVSRILMLLIAAIIVYSLGLTLIVIAQHLQLGLSFLDAQVMEDAFGSLLTIVILLEFNHSIAHTIGMRMGVVQVRVVVLIAILVVARKLILLNYKELSLEVFLSFAGLILALGALYWLIADAERRDNLPK